MSTIIPIGQLPNHNFDLEMRRREVSAEDIVNVYAEEAGVALPNSGIANERLEILLATLAQRARSAEAMLACYRLHVIGGIDAARPAERDEWQPSAEVEALTNELLGGFERAVDAYRNQLLDAKWEGECHIDDMARFVVGAMLVGEQPDEE